MQEHSPLMEKVAKNGQLRAVVLEDDEVLAKAYGRVLDSLDYDTTIVHRISDARTCIRDLSPELILLDIELPDGNGLDLMSELGASTRGRFVVISGDDSQRAAIKSIRNRAVQILVKPVSLDQLRQSLISVPEEAADHSCSSSTSATPSAQGSGEHSPGFWIDHGDSSALRELRIVASLSAERRRGHALIKGEAGLDKCSVGRAVHYRSRRVGECVVVNCASQTDEATITRFFGSVDPLTQQPVHCGYVEQARGGTLILENVHCLSKDMQSALMSFLDSGQFRPVNSTQSVSVVVAVLGTTGDTATTDNGFSTENRMRSDFMFRLAQLTLEVPNLSQCVGDLEAIAGFLLTTCTASRGQQVRFSPKALTTIARTQWPGNIRQLRSAIEESLLKHEAGDTLEIVSDQSVASLNRHKAPIASYIGTSIWEFERQLIMSTLDFHQGDRKAASKTLGVSLKTLYNRLNAY